MDVTNGPPQWFLRSAELLCALMLAVFLAGCSDVIPLQTGLSDADANEIVLVLDRHGIGARKSITKEGVTISVEGSDISRATQAMHAAGLPRRNRSSLGDVFKKEGMISTPLEERVRYIHGLSDELEVTLQQFDNVVAARVHVVLPERIAPGEPVQPSSAAVFVKYRPPFDEDIAIPRIRRLVASSIPGLAEEEARAKVSVVLAAAEPAAPAIAWAQVGPFVVQAQSASALRTTLIGSVVIALLGLLAAGAMWAHGSEAKTAGWLRKRLASPSGFKAARERT